MTVGMGEHAGTGSRGPHVMTMAHCARLRALDFVVMRGQEVVAGPPRSTIRTLDAIHLASALVARSTIPGLELLSLDDRIRKTARRLGLRLRPA